MKTVLRRQSGFTLLEMLVVVVIAGIMLGMVSLNAMPSERQRLETDAKRIASLLQLARDEAILRNLPVAFEADQFAYRFLIRQDQKWSPLKDELLRERQFEVSPMELLMDPPAANGALAARVVFGREPVDKPFVLTLRSGEASVNIQADGVGHFNVE